MAFTPFPFSNIVSQDLMARVVAFNWGYTVLETPAQFAKILVDEAKGYGINWEDSLVGTEGVQIAQAVQTYASFYQHVLTLPLPDNPSPEYAAWYATNH